MLAAFGRKLSSADVTKVTDKLLDDRGQKKLAELIAVGDAPQLNGAALSRQVVHIVSFSHDFVSAYLVSRYHAAAAVHREQNMSLVSR